MAVFPRGRGAFGRVVCRCQHLNRIRRIPGPPRDSPGYYNSVDTSNATLLRLTLHEVIDDHTRYPYTSTATDTWDILEPADEDPNNASNILDVYQNASFPKAGGGNANYQREHTWPSSYGFPNDNSTNYPFTDAHHLFLAYGSYNASRSNLPYATCNPACTDKTTEVNNGKGGGSGTYPGNSNWRTGSGSSGTWEKIPIDEEQRDWTRRFQIAVERAPARWDGSELPEHMPAFRSFVPAYTGEVWVHRPGPNRRLRECADPAGGLEELMSRGPCWERARAYEVFGPDGRFLGQVDVPDELERLDQVAQPWIAGDQFIAAVSDEAGTVMVKRYRLVLASE